MNLEIRQLSPETLDDYLAFFDGVAFTDNHDWAGCYCYFNMFSGTEQEWVARTGAQNRASVAELVRAGGMQGYLAYTDGSVVGWCNANDRTAVPMYDGVEPLRVPEGVRVCAISCFVIAPDFRRQGVARQLLRYAVARSAEQGFDFVEAYPRVGSDSCAHNYHGFLQMYLDEGFAVFQEHEAIRVVRKQVK